MSPRTFVVAAMLFFASALYARSAEPLRMIKTVPEGAVISYQVNGTVVQAMALTPGSYEIIIRPLSGGSVHGRPQRKPR